MLLCLTAAFLATVASVFAECDRSRLPDSQKELGFRLCTLEEQMTVVENALQEVLQRVDMTVDTEVPEISKRKNEFIRFGKRSEPMKRKNEFIRFGKRKNEFIRFGRSDPLLAEVGDMEKRKNEFIRFG